MKNIIIPLLIALSAYTAHSEEKLNNIYRFDHFEFKKSPIESKRKILDQTVDLFKDKMGDIRYIHEQEFNHKTQFDYLKINNMYVYYNTERHGIWVTIDKDGKEINRFNVLYSQNRLLLKYAVLTYSSMQFWAVPWPTIESTDINTKNGTWTAYYSSEKYQDVFLGMEKGGFAIRPGVKFSSHPGISKEEMRQFYSDFLDIIIHNKNPKQEKETILRLLDKEKKRKKEEFERNRLANAKKKPEYGIAYRLYPDDEREISQVAELRKQLNFPKGSEENANPNINSGKCQQEWIINLWKKKGVQIEFNRPNSMGAILSSTDNDNKTTCLVSHYQTQKDALDGLALMIGLSEPIDDGDMAKQAADCALKLQKRPGLVGDFAMSSKIVLNQAGGIIPQSDESAIYFIRGNSAVALKSSFPSHSVLSLARKIDEELKKGINAAKKAPPAEKETEPSRPEQ